MKIEWNAEKKIGLCFRQVFARAKSIQQRANILIMSDSGNGFDLGPNSASRHEKSLGLLTTRFVSLLQDAKDGVLDLKLVSDE